MKMRPFKLAQGTRRALYMAAVIAMTLGGLGLVAGGGYLLLAQDGAVQLPTSMREVLAEESTPAATPRLTAVVPVGAPSGTAAAPLPDTVVPTLASVDTPAARITRVVLAAAASTEVPTATVTRVVRVTLVPTLAVTALPGSSELPDTGFGDFVQPIAGLGLAGIALITHAIRRRR
jgi:LPXTG-motif cell wall-anchored protein